MSETDSKLPDLTEPLLHEHFRFVVDPKQSALRIDLFLLGKIERITRSKLQKAIKNGSVLVNDKAVKPNYLIRPNDKIVIVLPEEPKEKQAAIPEEMDLDIRYEDDHLIILYKPPGLVVHPGTGNRSGTLVNGLAHYMAHQSSMPILPGNDMTRPGLVHRIDKDTSGLMVIAKSDHAMAHLAKQFFDHNIDREYLAIVWGTFDESKGTIEGNIGRHHKERTRMAVYPDGDEGTKEAITHYEVLEDLYYVSLVKCVLETGRTHQIRVHLASQGHPLFNDERYGGSSIVKGTVFTKYKQFVQNTFKLIPRQALHAKSIGFIHPETKEYMKFETELPEDMQNALDKWRHYVTHKKSQL